MIPYLKLIRPKALLLILFFQLSLHFGVINPLLAAFGITPILPTLALVLLLLGTLLIAASGYVINDYFDTKIDALLRPDEVIVGEQVSRDAASRFYQALMGAGIVCGLSVALWCRSLSVAFIFIITPGLLWFYSASYKRQFLLGNAIAGLVASLSAIVLMLAESAFLSRSYGEFAVQTGVNGNLYAWGLRFAFFAFLLVFLRDLIKDIADEFADRETEARTLPVVWGVRNAKRFAALMTFLVALSFLVVSLRICFSPDPSASFHFGTWHADKGSLRYMLCAVIAPLLVSVYVLLRAQKPSDFLMALRLTTLVLLTSASFAWVLFHQLLKFYPGVVNAYPTLHSWLF